MSSDRQLNQAVDDADDGDLEPVDPDFALIGDYLAKELPAEQMQAVERRLVEDGEFFEKVWPIVEIWQLPRYARQRRARARRKAQGLVPQRTQSPAAPPLALLSDQDGGGGTQGRPRFSAKTKSWIGMAAAVAIAATGIVRLGPTMFSVANAGERASVADLRDSVQVETGRGETKVLTLAGGSRLIMRENSRITYKRFPGGFVNLALAAFDGELALELNNAGSYAYIRTSSGRALFTSGTYALRCKPGCAGMLVTVGVGSVQIRGDSGRADAVTLKDGEKGRVPKHGHPEKVTTALGRWRATWLGKWPALVPAKAP
jgi:ferric-dicitrate binding protein FerR (iron transport regulator)